MLHKKILWLFKFNLLLLGCGVCLGQTTWHVDDDGCPAAGTGTKSDPFCSIQAGIDQSVNGDEILVASGTYNEIINFNNKAVSLQSMDGPEVTTIDAAGFNDSVVQMVSGEGPDSILSGFTIQNGFAFLFGGGIKIENSSPTILNNIIRDNALSGFHLTACYGAGIYVLNGSPSIIDCRFIDNIAARNFTHCTSGGGSGGGIAVFESNPEIRGCLFQRNEGLVGAGGIYITDHSSMSITDCQFIENIGSGGAGIGIVQSSATIKNCLFKDNISGGIYLDGVFGVFGDVIIDRCVFIGNKPRGGIQNNSGDPLIINSIFVNNSNESTSIGAGGGAISNEWFSFPTIFNCIFSGNTSLEGGGAINNIRESSPQIINSTFFGNSTGKNGSVMHSFARDTCGCVSQPVMTNCILWGNLATPIFDDINAITTINFSNVEGGFSGTGNIDLDPFFVDPDGPDDIVGTLDDNLQLLPESPCIDAGDNSIVPADAADLDEDMDTAERTPLDLAQRPRFVNHAGSIDTGNGTGSLVDMGAYEFQDDPVPAVSLWGLMVMLLLLLIVGTLILLSRHQTMHRFIHYQIITGWLIVTCINFEMSNTIRYTVNENAGHAIFKQKIKENGFFLHTPSHFW